MGISVHPFEFEFIFIVDSMDNELMKFLFPNEELLKPFLNGLFS